MNSFAQRIDEKSAINPSGFTGVIVQNSNAVIDKTFIEKGTSFVNAYENSNVVLKDCGSPNPTFSENTTIAKKLKTNLKVEVERAKLPPWIYYKLGRTSNYNVKPNNFSNGKLFELELINSHDTEKMDAWSDVSDYRNQLVNSAFRKSQDDANFYNNESLSIENQILTHGKHSTKDIDFTLSGMYWLEGVESAIKVVWPLDKKHQDSIDNPKLNLRYKERLLFPLKNLTSNELIYMNNTYKEDELGNLIKSNVTTFEFSPKTHKHIVETSLNDLQKQTDQYQQLQDNKLVLNEVSGVFYFDGPYYNRNEIAYYVNDKYNGKILKNDENVTDFYFTFDNATYSLFDVINKKDTIPSSVLAILNDQYVFSSRRDNKNRFSVDILTVTDIWDKNNYGQSTNIVGFANVNSANDTSIPLAKNTGSNNYEDVSKHIFTADESFDLDALRNYPFYKNDLDSNIIYLKEDFQNAIFSDGSNDAITTGAFTRSDKFVTLTVNKENHEANISAQKKMLAAYSVATTASFTYEFEKCNGDNHNEHGDSCSAKFFKISEPSDRIFGLSNLSEDQKIEFDNVGVSAVIYKRINEKQQINVHTDWGSSDTRDLPSANVQTISAKYFTDISGIVVTQLTEKIADYKIDKSTPHNLLNSLNAVFKVDTDGTVTAEKSDGSDTPVTQSDVNEAMSGIFTDNKDFLGVENTSHANDYFSISSNFIRIISDNTNVIFVRPGTSSPNAVSENSKQVFYILSSDFKNYDNWFGTGTQTRQLVNVSDYISNITGNSRTDFKKCDLGNPPLSSWLLDIPKKLDVFKNGENAISTTISNDLGTWFNDDSSYGSVSADFISGFIQNIVNEYYKNGYIDTLNLNDLCPEDEQYDDIDLSDVDLSTSIDRLNENNKLPSFILFKIPRDPGSVISDYLTYIYKIDRDWPNDRTKYNFFDESKIFPLIDGNLNESVYYSFDLNNIKLSANAEIPSGILSALGGYSEYSATDNIFENANKISGNLLLSSNLINNEDESLFKVISKALKDSATTYGNVTSSLYNLETEEFGQIKNGTTPDELADNVSAYFKNIQNSKAWPAIPSSFGLVSVDIATGKNGDEDTFKLTGLLSAVLTSVFETEAIEPSTIAISNPDESKEWYAQNGLSSYYLYTTNDLLNKKSFDSSVYARDPNVRLSKLFKLNPDRESLKTIDGLYNVTEYGPYEINNNRVNIRIHADSVDAANQKLKDSLNSIFQTISLNDDQQLSALINAYGVLYNTTSTDGVSYVVQSALHTDQQGVVSLTRSPAQSSLYYYGTPLNNNFKPLTTTDIILTTYSTRNSGYEISIEEMNDKHQYGNIGLFFDKNCKIPLEVSGDTIFYDHDFNGSKRIIDGQLQYMPAYVYKTVSAYVSDTFNDWYNANTYINYAKINDGEENDYLINISNSNVALSDHFTDDYFIVTTNDEDSTTITLNSNDEFNTLFKDNDNENPRQQLKMLSFNFCIPKSGWYEFDEQMYAKNPNYTKAVSGGIGVTIPSGDALSAAQLTATKEFEGVFYAKYKIYSSDVAKDLNDRAVMDIKERILTAYSENTHTYKAYFQAKIRSINENTLRLDVFSENNTLNFSTNLTKKEEQTYFTSTYELKGLILTFTDNNKSAHHIQFPHIKIYCIYDSASSRLIMSFKTNNISLTNDGAVFNTEELSSYINADLMKKGTPLSGMLSGAYISKAESEILTGWYNTLSTTYSASVIPAEELKKWQSKFAKYNVSLSASLEKLTGDDVVLTDNISLAKAKDGLKSKIGNIEINEFKLNLPSDFKFKAATGGSCEAQWGPDFPLVSSDKPSGFIRILLKDIAVAKGETTFTQTGNFKTKWMHNVQTTDLKYSFSTSNKDDINVVSSWFEARDHTTGSGTGFKLSGPNTISNYNANPGAITAVGCPNEEVVNNIRTLLFDIISYFGDGKVINGKKYVVQSIYERHHCVNSTLPHDAYIILLSGTSTNYHSVFQPSSFPYTEIFEYANILPQIATDKTTEFFNNYMTINDLAFMPREVETNESFLTSSEWSNWEDFEPQSANAVINSSSDDSSISILDLEPFVRPFDMSTNLLYYKAGNSENSAIADENEVLIINAKKMYNSVDDDDEKPKNGALSLQLKNLFDKEITLTGRISLNDEPFEEIYPYVNDDYKYSFSTEIEDDDLINDGFKRIKYTDYRAKAPIWRLHKLKSKMLTLTTTDDFKATFTPIAPNGIGSLEQNDFDLPCRLSLRFNDLIFKQKARSGSKFDDVTDITYKNRIYRKDFLTSTGTISDELSSRWHISGYEAESTVFEFPYDPTTSGYNTIVSASNYFKINIDDDCDNQTSTKIGGPAYFNDIAKMNTIANSVNKWETVYSRDKYANLEVFSDYCPGDHCVGTPYLNMAAKVGVFEEYPTGTAGGGTGIISSAASVGEVMRIATDIANVNNIKTLETVESLPDYAPNSDLFKDLTCKVVSAGLIEDNLLILSAVVSGTVFDTSLIGKKEVPIVFETNNNGNGLNANLANLIKESKNENSIYIYFDGLYFDKDVYLNDVENAIETTNNLRYMIADIRSSNVYLNESGELTGSVVFQASLADDVFGSLLEVHNVKPLAPTISEMKISFTSDEEANTDKNGFISIDDNIWQKKVKFNKDGYIQYDGDEQPIFTIESEPIKSWVKEVYDENNKLTDLIVTVKIGGLKKFKQPQYATYYYFENPTLVTLSSQELVNDYTVFDEMTRKPAEYEEISDGNTTTRTKVGGIEDSEAANYFAEVFPEFVPSAQLGQTVTSGILRWKTNDVNTEPFSGIIENAGIYEFGYNPIGRDEFQVEIITKPSGVQEFTKDVYYTNLKTDRWYNLSLFNLLRKRNSDSAPAESRKGLYITDVTGNQLEDVTSKQTDIVRCFVSNDKIIEGNQIYSDIQDADVLNDILSSTHLHNYKSVYNISFDACSRTPYNLKYSNDAKQLQYLDTDINETEYEKQWRQNNDLWKLSDSLSKLSGLNESATIKLFANKDLNEAFNVTSETAHIALIDYSDTSEEYRSSNNCPITVINGDDENSQAMHKILNRFIPRKAYFGSDQNDYILREKDMTYHISPVNGMKVKSVMWINTPNLYNSNAEKSYYDTSVGALSAIQESFEYFSNPQHKLPCVNYTQKILDSDYATLVYNSCQTFEAAKSATSLNYNDSTIIYNYDKNPKIIAYVWDNAKVSRNETYDSTGNIKSQKLCWVKSNYNEYIAEVGSIYNYQDSQDYVNIVKIETGSITDRQIVMQPVLSTPLTFEKKSAEAGIVKVNDKIIATAALGYNNVGYPINSVMLFNPENALNNDINIDTTQTTYLYVAQNDQSSECIVGSTQEKPVYVDMISQNVASNNERFSFLPNPYNDNREPEDMDPTYKLLYQGTGNNVGVTKNDKLTLKFGYAESLTELSSSYTELRKTNYSEEQFTELIYSEDIEKNATPLGNHTYYDYTQNYIYRSTGIDKIVSFYSNALAANSVGKTPDAANKLDLLNVLNVFSDIDEAAILQVSGVNTTWETMNCFSFDGRLIGSDEGTAERPIDFTKMIDNNNSYLAENAEKVFLNGLKNITDIEPTVAVVWLNDSAKQINYNEFIENTTKTINNERSVVFDQYYSANVTSVKFTINSEHIKNAPIYIKISFLKAEKDSNNRLKFVWKHDDIYDVDLRDTYKDEFDLVGSKKEIIKDFILQPSGNDIIKHIFGIKFTIKQIMPQNDEYNKAIIDNIAIYSSNVLNKYGQSLSVEDVYVRKADANCRNHYKMDVAEYVWRLPKRSSEWKTLYKLLSGDVNSNKQYIDQDEYDAVSKIISGLAYNTNTTAVSAMVDNPATAYDQFSFLNSYFITSNTGAEHIREVLSDSYLVESNMKITWKYVDYVYIYYSCYSPNARQLIERKFGDKIYNAVKAKLNANIKNMNANSAFKDKFEFRGGIAVSKSEALDENQHTDVFNWNQTQYLKKNYTNVFRTTQQWGTESQDVTYEVTTYRDQYNTRKGRTVYAGTTYAGTNRYVKTDTKDWYTSNTEKIERLDSEENHYGAAIENGKYMSVDNWTNSFAPIMIKYQID